MEAHDGEEASDDSDTADAPDADAEGVFDAWEIDWMSRHDMPDAGRQSEPAPGDPVAVEVPAPAASSLVADAAAPPQPAPGDPAAVEVAALAASSGVGDAVHRPEAAPGDPVAVEVPAPAAADEPGPCAIAEGARAPSGANFHSHFGPHQIVNLPGGGLSLQCLRHWNENDNNECAKDMGPGGRNRLSREDMLLRLKRWCILGYGIPTNLTDARKKHNRGIDARQLSERLPAEGIKDEVWAVFSASELAEL